MAVCSGPPQSEVVHGGMAAWSAAVCRSPWRSAAASSGPWRHASMLHRTRPGQDLPVHLRLDAFLSLSTRAPLSEPELLHCMPGCGGGCSNEEIVVLP
mmetsp:Transcript_39922/g.78965  ORF Transcript_39922/g.78965 Transcript_39922/m.78965 type:complete len:98 (-) Transcript_39922:89-382(-)